MAKFFLYLKEWIWDLFVNGIISSYLVHFKVRNIFYYIAGIKKISVKKSAIDPEKARRYRQEAKPEKEDTCSMCGNFCAVKNMNKIMDGEIVSIFDE